MENPSTSDSYFSDIYATTHEVQYAGFWIRFVALIIDSVVLMIPGGVLYVFFVGDSLFSDPDTYAENPFATFSLMGSYFMASSLMTLLYKAILESSSWQATLGKKALDLKVTDEQGQRISFLRALGRALSTYLSTLIFYIGYIIAAFTSRKQALHDKIAGTLVIKTR